MWTVAYTVSRLSGELRDICISAISARAAQPINIFLTTTEIVLSNQNNSKDSCARVRYNDPFTLYKSNQAIQI